MRRLEAIGDRHAVGLDRASCRAFRHESFEYRAHGIPYDRPAGWASLSAIPMQPSSVAT